MLIRAPGDTAAGSQDGSILVLIIGYVAIAAVLITVGIDVSTVSLAHRALASAADSAALAAAQGVDTTSVYGGSGLRCGEALPLDPQDAAGRAAASVASARTDLRRTFAVLDEPATTVTGTTATVTMSGDVAVPFGKVLGWLDPSHADGEVRITETSHAQSPVAGGAC